MRPENRLRGAVRELTLFLSIVAVLTGALIAVVVAEDVNVAHLDDASALGQLALFGQAFVPGIAAIAVGFLSGRRLHGLGLRPRGLRRYALVSYLIPLAYTGAAYAVLWGSGAGAFDGGGDVGAAVLGLTAGVIPFTLLALGEEVGWRGLMTARLAEVTSLPVNALLTGLAWTAFHLPLMVLVPGAVEDVPVAYAVATFAISSVALSYPMAWLRLRTGSIWPAALMHAAGNAAMYLAAEPLTRETADTAWFGGETGILLPLATVAVAIAWWRRTSPRSVAPAYEVATPSTEVIWRNAS
jgi:membrane protease YdiL (CAAX protease family)